MGLLSRRARAENGDYFGSLNIWSTVKVAEIQPRVCILKVKTKRPINAQFGASKLRGTKLKTNGVGYPLQIS